MKDENNTPDINDFHATELDYRTSNFEDAYFQMMIGKEGVLGDDAHPYDKKQTEDMFDLWNERFNTNVQPHWKREV